VDSKLRPGYLSSQLIGRSFIVFGAMIENGFIAKGGIWIDAIL
jgi:hypothetical protein